MFLFLGAARGDFFSREQHVGFLLLGATRGNFFCWGNTGGFILWEKHRRMCQKSQKCGSGSKGSFGASNPRRTMPHPPVWRAQISSSADQIQISSSAHPFMCSVFSSRFLLCFGFASMAFLGWNWMRVCAT